MPVLSKEETLFGAVLIVSGLSQSVYSWAFSESTWLILGISCATLGVALSILGFAWTAQKPLGITVLGLSYGVCGILTTLFSVLFFTPLLSLAAVCFVLSWGVIRRKAWARSISLFTTALLLSSSIVAGITSTLLRTAEILPYIPSTLVSTYLLWYLVRPHVPQLFGPENKMQRGQGEETPNKRGLIPIILGFLLLASFLAYAYLNPPSGMPIGAEVNIRGSLGAGELGTPALGRELQFWASRGDLLVCSYQNAGSEPVHVWVIYNTNQDENLTIFEKISLAGSDSVWAPQTGDYSFWVTTQEPGRADVLCEVWVTSFSLRRPTVQSLLLSLVGFAVSISMMRTPRKTHAIANAQAC